MSRPASDGALGVYLHVPFCVHKCSYCDFNAYSGMEALVEPYVDALSRDIASSPAAGRGVETIFFGGGTPSYLSAGQLTRALDAVRSTFDVVTDAEVTSEVNPTTAEAGKFAAMREAGFNRLSIGVQSFDSRLLRAAERWHSPEEAEEAVRAARQAGFDNVSIDLIFALPGQTREDWDATLGRAIDLGTEHLSVYALTLEPGTRFERLHAGGKLELPDEDTELWMYERAIERLGQAGLGHYEVSNFARPGRRARHNLLYWHNREYAGFGPGAVSYMDGRRWTREKQPARYIEKVMRGADPAIDGESLGPAAALAETLILGLRLREGVRLPDLTARFGVDPRERFAEPIARLQTRGLIEMVEGRLRLTHAGLLFANDVFLEFLP